MCKLSRLMSMFGGNSQIAPAPVISGPVIKKALIVGTDHYAMPGNNLNGCVADSEDVYNLLVNDFKFPADNIRVLTNDRSTKANVVDRLNWLVSGDGIMECVYYNSSHGTKLRIRQDGELGDVDEEAIVTYDFDWDDRSTQLVADDIHNIIIKLNAQSRLMTIVDSCLAGNTKIPLLNGTEKTIEEMCKEGGKYWVYSSKPNGEVVPGFAHSARIMGKKKLLKITLDNGEFFECTEDHRIMLRDGSFKEAGKLLVNESLMPLYRRIGTKGYLKGYEEIHTTSQCGNRRWEPTHKIVRDYFGMYKTGTGKTICHHKDFNKKNNTPDNLEMMSWYDHKRCHGDVARKNIQKMWANEEFKAWRKSDEYRKQQSERIKKSWQNKEHREAHLRGAATRDYSECTARLIKYNKSEKHIEDMHKYWDNNEEAKQKEIIKKWNHSEEGQKHAKAFGQRMKEKLQANNHKVVKIEDTGSYETVYDLTVDEHHNFALSCGIFVHNCHSENVAREMGKTPKFIVPPFCIRARSLNRNLKVNRIAEKACKEFDNHAMLSGCKDDQTSAETRFGNQTRGALTFNTTKRLRASPEACWTLIHKDIVQSMKDQGFDQDPILSGSIEILNRLAFGGKS